jgi:hypothetical protein
MAKKPPFLFHQYALKISNLGVLWFVNFYIFNHGLKNPQCCDTEQYQLEAKAISENGFFVSGDSFWLFDNHNYMYASFIHLLSLIGISGRVGISYFQFLFLMVTSTLVYLKVIKNQTQKRLKLFLVFLILTIFLNYNYTPFTLTEGLASGTLLLLGYLLARYTILNQGNKFDFRVVLLISALSSALWMIRPAFIWLASMLNLILLLHIILNHSKTKDLILKFSGIFTMNGIILLPQVLVSNHETVFNRLTHFSNYKALEDFESSVFRYVTNLSGCGPNPMIFSPYGQDEGSLNPNYLRDPISNVAGFVARLVSGWDAFPSSVVYLTSFSVLPPILVTAMSGMVFISTFFLGFHLISQGQGIRQLWHKLILPFVFIISQLTVGFTHGEFRYNIAGWILGFISLIVLIVTDALKGKIPLFIFLGVMFSFFFLVIGQLTLLYSDFWQQCFS